MKGMPILGALALSLAATAVPSAAQDYRNDPPPSGGAYGSDFWRGAPDGLSQRIDWLQNRINQGVSDGSLDRGEARRAQYQLDSLRNQAADLQRRLDDLSRGIRWARNNGPGPAYGGPGGRDPYATDYDASRYYRDDPRYVERRLSAQDEVYRGSDGRYYCKRSDGTTGLVVGGLGGAALGNVIDGGHSRVAGTLIGGALGALVGQAVDRNSDVRCR